MIINFFNYLDNIFEIEYDFKYNFEEIPERIFDKNYKIIFYSNIDNEENQLMIIPVFK